MPPPDFSGPELKTERAEHHIDQLEVIFDAFVRKNTKKIFAKAHNRKWRDRELVIGGEFPRHTPTVIGDAVHNLRAALDHAYCLLVEANGHVVSRQTYFPFGDNSNSVSGTINGQIAAGSGPSDKVRDAILNVVQPFPGGKGERLYGIHKLDRTDKHRILIPTASRVHLHGFKVVTPNGGTVEFNDFTLSTLNPEVQRDGMLTLRNVHLKAEKNAKASLDVCFQNGQPFEGESIVNTLRDLLVLTQGALKVLRNAAA